MNIDSKETLCSRCIHKVVCAYSNGYLSILKAVSEARVPQPGSNVDGSGYKKVIDFDFIEQGAKRMLPKDMEWYGAFGLMVTLVWLYLEILRLLAKLQDRK